MARRVQRLIRSLEGPTDLEALGFATADIPAPLSWSPPAPTPNPRHVTQDDVAELLRQATTINGDR
jgi:alcohol dehydrogenase class IV